MRAERHVARRRALELSDEDGLPLEHGERARIGSAVEVRQAEEDALVVLAEGADARPCGTSRDQLGWTWGF